MTADFTSVDETAAESGVISDFLSLQTAMREGRLTFPEYLDAWEALLNRARPEA